MMNHWKNDELFGENWFTFTKFYSEVAREIPEGSTIVEVGAWKGRSAAFLAEEFMKLNKKVTFYVVDIWEGDVSKSSKLVNDADGNVTHNSKSINLYELFLSNLKPFEKYYFPLKLKSVDASKRFENGSLDFVFIDGSHEYEDVYEDILHWKPKVKSGGILAGHDYTEWFPGVTRAVDEQISKFITRECCWVSRIP